jgi:hypothetical protein
LVAQRRLPTSTLAATLTIESARVLCRRCGARGNYMSMHSLAARTHVSSMPARPRPLGLRTQMMVHGPGWRLADGEVGTWLIKLVESDDSIATWVHMLRTVRNIAATHGLRPTLIDLRGGSRLAGASANTAALLFEEFEQHGIRISTVVGTDLIHAARLHRLLGTSAAAQGRCFLTEDEAIEWVSRSVPPVPPPVPPPLHRQNLRALLLQPPRV